MMHQGLTPHQCTAHTETGIIAVQGADVLYSSCGIGDVCFYILSFSILSPSLWETARANID